MVAGFLLESVHIYQLVTNVCLDTAMATDRSSPLDSEIEHDIEVVKLWRGPYTVNVSLLPTDNDNEYIITKITTTQNRPAIIGPSFFKDMIPVDKRGTVSKSDLKGFKLWQN